MKYDTFMEIGDKFEENRIETCLKIKVKHREYIYFSYKYFVRCWLPRNENTYLRYKYVI